MVEATYVMMIMNFNRVECDAWIEERKRTDGDYDLAGMGRSREFVVMRSNVELTGLRAFAATI
jgi:hypothetical protein